MTDQVLLRGALVGSSSSAVDPEGEAAYRLARALCAQACRDAAGDDDTAEEAWTWIISPLGARWARHGGLDHVWPPCRETLREARARGWTW